MNLSSTVDQSLLDLLNMLQGNCANPANTSFPINPPGSLLLPHANSTASIPIDLSMPSSPINRVIERFDINPTIPAPTVPFPINSASITWQNQFFGARRPLAQTVPSATFLEMPKSFPPNPLDNFLAAKTQMSSTLQNTGTTTHLPTSSVPGLLQPFNMLPQADFLGVQTLNSNFAASSLGSLSTALDSVRPGLCMPSGSTLPSSLQNSTRDSPSPPSLTPNLSFMTEREMEKILDSPFSGDCSPQDFARQAYAILARGSPDDQKKKTLEVLEHVIKSPIYEDWINVRTMNIYDPSDVEAIWKPQKVRKPSETKNMFYRWFIKTGRGNSEEAREAWLRMPPATKQEGTERKKWYQRSKAIKAEHQFQLSKGYIVVKEETRRLMIRPY
ncbi:hypothetical protein CRE_06295 [Caenorhabditis remanei]|uniref:Uncharacterized protein n=1 Tax=Caenorhabditis remanei TaxID=31234 RepID=E3M126_CAERE|nr:hypothetical protein CRE_06295 [Caenorhabditis remanei]